MKPREQKKKKVFMCKDKENEREKDLNGVALIKF